MTLYPKRRILVIDDQESIHQDYRKIITPAVAEHADLAAVEEELFGNVTPKRHDDEDVYEIDSAFQGDEAVTLVRQALAEGRPYAVAFVDIRMPPGCDGVQTIRQLWDFDPDLLVVICSAYSDYCWEDIVRELGRSDRFLVLRKPFENMEVRQCAAALTERWVIARTDALTGLLNRRALTDHLQREWSHSVCHQQPLCCVMLDIDYFKSINDRFGHSVGDQVLQSLSSIILEHKRPGDTACRYGGEEIFILMPNTTTDDGCQWAELLRLKISQLALRVEQTDLHITASFGVYASSTMTLTQNELVDRADTALRQAKKAGRNRVMRWAPDNDLSSDTHQIPKYAALFANVQARDLMTNQVACIPQDVSVIRAVETLLQGGLHSAPVVDEEGTLLGLISETDVMDALCSDRSWFAGVVDVMSLRPIHYEPETSAEVIFDFFCRVQLRSVLVVEAGRPVGVISRASFLRWIKNHLTIQESTDPDFDSRKQLLHMAESLLNRTIKLRDDLASDPDDMKSPLVCAVSSIEFLLDDLLTWAGCSRLKEGARSSLNVYEQC